MAEPLYTAANCRVAYQLRWSLTLFAAQAWPETDSWWQPLSAAVEPNGVRLLEFQPSPPASGQFLVSSKPEASPAQIVRSVKGRLQHLVRDAIPKLWRRHYSMISVGDANNDVLQGYVGRQVEHHPLADPRIVDRLSQAQFHDPHVDLGTLRASAHGRFIHSLHLVLENAEHLCDTREEWLATSRAMVIGACRKKCWLLSRLALVGNHLHILLGCDVADVPRDTALALMNNLAFAHGMKPVYEFSYYIGTFGPYDHNAIRLRLAGGTPARPCSWPVSAPRGQAPWSRKERDALASSWPVSAPRGQAPWSRKERAPWPRGKLRSRPSPRPPGLPRRGAHWWATMQASLPSSFSLP